MRRRLSTAGLSLIEVVVALGLAAFALLSLMVLLPVGMKTNQASSEETQAADLLTAVEADLRNSATTSGRSHLFGLVGPYMLSSSGRLVLNPAAKAASTLAEGQTTIGVKGDETVVALAGLPHFQASVVYIQAPSSGSLLPIQARLIINWPGRNLNNPKFLADPSKVSGHVEAYVTFSAP